MFELLRLIVREEMHLQENTLFDIDLGVKVTRNFAQYPLHHVTYAALQFEAARSFKRCRKRYIYKKRDAQMHVQTDGRTDDGQTLVWNKYTIFFSKEKRGYNKGKVSQSNESKNTVDGNCMTKKLLIVMFSTNPTIGEQIYTNE